MNLRSWISAARLRTLPLASAGILMGYALAEEIIKVDHLTFFLCLGTAIGLQILANFANDYGDFQKGTDNQNRIGPIRQLQSGKIKPRQMKIAMVGLAVICLVMGITLVFRTVGVSWPMLLFILLGLVSIWAAVSYTVGQNAYGYRAQGDIFVFLFFGLLAVLGSAYLFSGQVLGLWILPALFVGCNSVGVLNLNNMRDLENDLRMGKMTTAGKMGLRGAKIYQSVMLGIGFFSLLIYDLNRNMKFHIALDMVVGLITVIILYQTWTRSGKDLNPLLRNLSLLTFFAVLFRLQEFVDLFS